MPCQNKIYKMNLMKSDEIKVNVLNFRTPGRPIAVVRVFRHSSILPSFLRALALMIW